MVKPDTDGNIFKHLNIQNITYFAMGTILAFGSLMGVVYALEDRYANKADVNAQFKVIEQTKVDIREYKQLQKDISSLHSDFALKVIQDDIRDLNATIRELTSQLSKNPDNPDIRAQLDARIDERNDQVQRRSRLLDLRDQITAIDSTNTQRN